MARLVKAQRFRGQIITGALVGAGPATPTHADVLAATALAFVFLEVSQVVEYGGSFPDFRERLFTYIATIELKISARLHPADMRDESKAHPAQTSTGCLLYTSDAADE